jgi:hypothetical protein
MIKIAVTGHRPDAFIQSHYSTEEIKRIADNIVCAFKREYKDDLTFNLGGAIGADLWVGEACINNEVPFVLYLPFHPDVQTKYWSLEQKKELERQMSKSCGINIVDPNQNTEYKVANYFIRNMNMIDDANFVVAFWVGKKRGGTYNAMLYGLNSSKFVFNALDELKPIFKDNLKMGWTPPTIKVNNNE